MRMPGLILTMSLLCNVSPSLAQSGRNDAAASNNLTYAVAWKQTAAEYRALFHQGFNVARRQVAAAVASRNPQDRPLAVVADVDDTLLLSSAYWGFLVASNADFFQDDTWDEWVRSNRAEPSPGALAFLRYCRDNDVEVFYLTSRDQGEDTFELALNNLVRAGFPYADADHLTVLRESSNKQAVQDRLRESHQLVVLLGDNLNDFSRRYYVDDVDTRMALMEEDSEYFGSQFVLFPNPTDGHWIRAIFGESEPPASDVNRGVLHQAATRESWNGP